MAATSEAPGGARAHGGEEPRRPRRPWTTRVSRGHLVVLFAGLVAAVTNFAVLRGQLDRVRVLVAAEDLHAGQVVTGDLVEARTVRVEGPILDALLGPGDVDGARPLVAATALEAGTPLRGSDLRPVAAADGKRRMSVPVDPARAAGGAIAVGDRVDVIHVVAGIARYVVTDARVLEVDRPPDPVPLGGSGGLSLTLEVDAGAALCLSRAIQDGSLDVLVATGQRATRIPACVQSTRREDVVEAGW